MTGTFFVSMVGSFTVNTDSLAVEIDAPTNTTIKIKKIRITDTDGTLAPTNMNDYHRKIKLVTQSASGTGMNAFTEIESDDNNTTAVATVTTGPGTAGTISATIDTLSVHSATDFLWQAADEDDKIVVKPGESFGIIVNPAQ